MGIVVEPALVVDDVLIIALTARGLLLELEATAASREERELEDEDKDVTREIQLKI